MAAALRSGMTDGRDTCAIREFRESDFLPSRIFHDRIHHSGTALKILNHKH